jgi:hypothetical protein
VYHKSNSTLAIRCHPSPCYLSWLYRSGDDKRVPDTLGSTIGSFEPSFVPDLDLCSHLTLCSRDQRTTSCLQSCTSLRPVRTNADTGTQDGTFPNACLSCHRKMHLHAQAYAERLRKEAIARKLLVTCSCQSDKDSVYRISHELRLPATAVNCMAEFSCREFACTLRDVTAVLMKLIMRCKKTNIGILSQGFLKHPANMAQEAQDRYCALRM